jgi:hypothetical protein
LLQYILLSLGLSLLLLSFLLSHQAYRVDRLEGVVSSTDQEVAIGAATALWPISVAVTITVDVAVALVRAQPAKAASCVGVELEKMGLLVADEQVPVWDLPWCGFH